MLDLEGAVRTADFSDDERWLATGGFRTTHLWDLTAPDPPASVRSLPIHERDIRSDVEDLDISPDGHWLVTACGSVLRWDLTAEDPAATRRVLLEPTAAVGTLEISPDGRWLATGGKTVQLLDLTADDPSADVQILAGHDGVVLELAISPDGRFLAARGFDPSGKGQPLANGRDRAVWLWDLNTLDSSHQARVLSGHDDRVRALVFSPDGRWLATASSDNSARIWDLARDDPSVASRVLSGHTNAVEAVAFDPNGRWLATGSWDKTVRIWDLDVRRLMERAQSAVGRNFTRHEWDSLFPGEAYQRVFDELPED